MKKKKIALVLGGGGARGLSHIGVLKVLEKENIRPDFIVGVSMGALIGSCYALGMKIEELEKMALAFDRKKTFKEIVDISGLKSSLLKGEKIKTFLDKLLGDSEFSDTNIPITVLATDLVKGSEVLLNKGKLKDAVLASIAVPGIFPPVKSDRAYLVDGGVLNPTPIDVALKNRPSVVIGVDLIMGAAISQFNPSLINSILRTYDIMRTNMVRNSFATKMKNIVIVKPKENKIFDSFKFYNIDKFIKSGEEAMIKKMPDIKRILNSNNL